LRGRRAKKPIYRDEQFPHLGSIIVHKLANCDLGLQLAKGFALDIPVAVKRAR